MQNIFFIKINFEKFREFRILRQSNVEEFEFETATL